MGHEARANRDKQVGPVFIGVPFTKVDAENRTVTGLVTDEELDSQGDVVDFDTAKAFFTDDKLWPGNVREQHDPKKPVGSKVDVVVDDTAKTVTLTAYVSEACPDTWTKCLDKTLKGFSIGGSGNRVVEKVGNKVISRLFLKSLAEVSLVDNPANPRALFAVAKSVDGVMQPIEPGVEHVVVDAVDKASELLDGELAKADDSKDDDKNKTASGDEGKWYAGTDGKSFPISTAKDVANAARALGRTTQDKAKVKANIIRIANAHGLESGLPDAWKTKDDAADKAVDVDGVAKGGPEPYDIDSALNAISFVNRLMANEYWEARYAAAGASTDQKAQIGMLKAACDALLEFLQAEYEEQFEPDAGGGMSGGPLDLSDILDDDDAVEMFATALSVIKAGARHNATDRDLVQKGHDVMTALGANCAAPDDDKDTEKVIARLVADGYVVEKKAAAKEADAKDAKDCKTCKGSGKIRDGNVKCPDCKGSGDTAADKSVDASAIEKLTASIDTLKADHDVLKATVSEKDKTIASLEERVKVFENKPAGGGPVRSAHAVNKELGGPGGGTDEPTAGSIVKTLQEMADKNENQAVKAALAAEIIKIGKQTGTSQLDIRR